MRLVLVMISVVVLVLSKIFALVVHIGESAISMGLWLTSEDRSICLTLRQSRRWPRWSRFLSIVSNHDGQFLGGRLCILQSLFAKRFLTRP
ncbi:hypothetical protein KCV00_g201, partial [Aureobasidium melanogenum]